MKSVSFQIAKRVLEATSLKWKSWPLAFALGKTRVLFFLIFYFLFITFLEIFIRFGLFIFVFHVPPPVCTIAQKLVNLNACLNCQKEKNSSLFIKGL